MSKTSMLTGVHGPENALRATWWVLFDFKRRSGLVMMLLRFVGSKVLHHLITQRHLKDVRSCSALVWIPKRLDYTSTGNTIGWFFAECSRVRPPGQEDRSNALRVGLMDLCPLMESFEDLEWVHIVRSEQ